MNEVLPCKTIAYVLPSHRYFLDGLRGRVSHAKGFISGLNQWNFSVSVISGSGIANHISSEYNEFFEVRERPVILWWVVLLYQLVITSRKCTATVCRWRPVIPFLLLPLSFILPHRPWLEVNSLTGISSKSGMVRWFVRTSVYLSAKYFRLILVSTNSQNEILEVSGLEKLDMIVLPNGFEPRYFANFDCKRDVQSKCSLVYFGTKQSYYSWNMLYETAIKLEDAGTIDGLHIYGFEDDSINNPAIVFHGGYQLDTLTEKINDIPNPILVLHANSSQTAKSGSPMKLYEYFSLGVPVVVSDSLAEQCSEFEGCNFYTGDDAENLEQGLQKVTDDYSLYTDKASTLRDISLARYSWRSVVQQFIQRL